MQTWLVHTRHPLRLARELGPRGLLGFNLIGTGLIVSSLIYPVYLATLLAMATDPLRLWGDGGVVRRGGDRRQPVQPVAGYVAMAVLGRAGAARCAAAAREARGLILLPVYWLLMSLASYRAVVQLVVRPHHWEKTPHRPRRSAISARSTRPVRTLPCGEGLRPCLPVASAAMSPPHDRDPSSARSSPWANTRRSPAGRHRDRPGLRHDGRPVEGQADLRPRGVTYHFCSRAAGRSSPPIPRAT